jgi:hypothetical protein
VCKVDSDCPKVPLGAPCKVCPNGTTSCPTSQCVNGACQIVWPPC